MHDIYAALLADPEIDAIYNPLPNGLHAEWTIAALEAGKHVLCEKPFTANATEAEAVAAVAARTGLVVMEAFHYRYHPLAQRMREIVESGELGTIRRVEAALCFPLPKFSDIRYQYDLAGGATMDVGSYTVHLARLLGCEEPEVRSAEAKLHTPDVDRAMRAELTFPSGHTGRITCSMWSTWFIQTYARAIGDARRAARDQPDQSAGLAPHAREGRRHRPHRALLAPADLRVPARRVLRGRAARRADADAAGRLDRQHARDRRDLRRGGDDATRNVNARVPATADSLSRAFSSAELSYTESGHGWLRGGRPRTYIAAVPV